MSLPLATCVSRSPDKSLVRCFLSSSVCPLPPAPVFFPSLPTPHRTPPPGSRVASTPFAAALFLAGPGDGLSPLPFPPPSPPAAKRPKMFFSSDSEADAEPTSPSAAGAGADPGRRRPRYKHRKVAILPRAAPPSLDLRLLSRSIT
uniref:Uncharacterized protein n=1 Tax=Setaria viridis TaxID=4556 RepID=A0A4U6T4A0_SETVI|nr:hypothetical protein SEVIR_9G348900v2 [Setaria viridis]